jgi:hypothetical protein
MQTIQSIQLKEGNVKEYSSASLLLSLKKHFLRSPYSLDGQNLSNSDLSALLVYFGISYLKQNGSFKAKRDGTDKNEIFSSSHYLFESLKKFLPEKIASSMPAPNMASLAQARLFYEESLVGNEMQERFFKDIANLGFAYQIFSLGTRNKDTLVAVQSANKQITRQQLISFTQLYTPNWVVDFILANTVLPRFGQWKEKFPLRYANWLAVKNLSFSNKSDLANFSLLDPACGAGQFLFSAFDLLSYLFESIGYSQEESVNLALKNIHGADIDEKALWVAGLGLFCQSWRDRKHTPHKLANLVWSEKKGDAGFLGSIDRNWSKEHILGRSYDAVVMNPPYLGRKCLSRELKASLQEQYPDSSTDICAAFLKRGAEMLNPNGRLGLITQSSMLSIPSYQSLRNYLFNNYFFETIVRCGPRVFPLASGEKIDSAILVAEAPTKERDNVAQAQTQLYDLASELDKPNQLKQILSNDWKNSIQPPSPLITNFQTIKLVDGLAFGLPYQLLEKLASFSKLGDIADIKQGLATTDNARFVRYNFDVDPESIGSLWVPYVKGAGAEKFASDNPFVVKWGAKGEEIKKAVTEAYPYLNGKTAWVVKNEEFYFRPGLCFSFINKFGLAVRRLPAGAIFDVGSSAIFAKPEEENFLLAYLNSSLLGLLAKTINQTINIQVGDLKKLPIFPFLINTKTRIATLGQESLIAKQKLIQMQQANLKPLRASYPSLIRANQLERAFSEYENEHKKYSEQLKTLQIEIDDLILIGLKELSILDRQEELYLHNILDYRKIQFKDSRFEPGLFVPKIVVGLASSLICDDQNIERIKLISKTDKSSLAHSLGLSADGKDWLEQKLGSSLEKIFYRSKVTDISKLAKEPSRYFCLYVEQNCSYMFFSARAVREMLKLPIADHPAGWFWQPLLEKLNGVEDWTSKDLLSIIAEHYERNIQN